MPDANPGLMTIFADALEQSDLLARTAYLDRVCAGDASLRRRLEALLAAHDGAGRFLEPDATGAHEPPTQAPQDVTGTFDPDADRTSGILTGEFSADPRTVGVESTPSADCGAGAPVAAEVIAGRYTLVGVIGEGGMGTVYRAEQSKPVKREVALKLIKAGMDSRAVLARFDAERQALALMDHPNIARVYDGGTTESGQPFFVMELVNGVPITQYCDNARLPVRARLELFVSVCNAVQHAHQKGIIHRDLKPGNVLVTEVDGRPTPKVIDFGVAKATEQRLTDQSLADTGAIVGTPAYMSPEQADPSTLDIDTRTDVYALGVILYELLVGSPPIDAKQFKRGAILEMLRMVREVDPPRPSTKLSTTDALPSIAANRLVDPAQLKRAVRGDLDWIVMKSLEKDRTRRYDTANGFAADIQRHLSYEPVLAAPPSRAYRMRKFVRKNRGAVLAASLVVLALLTGIAGTTWGLLRADEEAGNARNREADAKLSEGAAIAARNAMEKANAALRESTDNLLSTAARSLLRPLALQVQPNQSLPPLNEQEIEPLWELASLKDEPLRLRFVEIALREPVSTRRLKDRAAVALHATVGLDRERRRQVEALLGKRLQGTAIPGEQQENVALCLAQLGGLDRSLAGRTAETFTQAMTKTTDPYALQSLSEGLSSVAARMDSKDAAQTCGQAAATLTQAMIKTTNPNDFIHISQGLSLVAVRMGPKDAAETAAMLTQAMTKTTDLGALVGLQTGLSTVAARMEPKLAVASLTQAVTTGSYTVFMDSPSADLSAALLAVTARMDLKDAAEAASTLTQAMIKTTKPNALWCLSQTLPDLAARMEPKEAAAVVSTLTQAITKTTEPNVLLFLSQALSTVAAHMDPKDATQAYQHAAATLTQAMTKTTDPNALQWLSQGLSAVAARMDPKDAAQTCEHAAATLTQAMTKTTDPNALWFLSEGLSAVVVRMEPKEAAQTCGHAANALIQAMTKATDTTALRQLSQGLSAVAARMDPKDAAITLAQAMTKTTESPTLRAMTSSNPNPLLPISEGLSAVAALMDPKDAAETGATLIQAMTKTTNPDALRYLSEGLSAVTARMDPKDATETGATLTQAMTKTANPDALQNLSRGLSAVAARMDPKVASATLIQVMTKTTDPYALQYLSQGLSVVAARMEPKDAAQTCGHAANTLIQAMTKTTEPYALKHLTEGLSAVAARIEPKVAAQTCGHAAKTLTQVITKTTDPDALQNLSRGLSAAANRMDPKDAAAAITQVMTETNDIDSLRLLSHGLLAVADRMDPKDAADTAARLTQAMTKTTEPYALGSLSRGLAAVAARMDPRDAAQVCREAAAALTQAITKTTDTDFLRSLSLALSAVLSREESSTPRQRLISVTATVGALAGPGPPFAALAAVQPALKPPPPPLPPQTLVDILKNPFCVGEARRLVLEQLTRHYHRPFADQWEFVDFVHAQKLDLDLTTPPERPRLVP